MDRKTIPYTTLTNAIKRFAAQHRSDRLGLVPCPAEARPHHSNAAGLRAVLMKDGTYRICNVRRG